MILIDSNSICHQAKHRMSDLSFHEKQTGVMFGFLNQILSLAKTLHSNEFIYTWDSRESLRTNLFPDYKKVRRHEKTAEEKELDSIAYSQFDTLRKEILPEIGFVNSFMIDGFEADDLMASITFTNPEIPFDIVSTDEDLYQLLSDNVRLYSTKKKQFYTNHNLWKEYGVTPDEWPEVKAIAGCNTDGVPGVEGVGEKTACKYINRNLSIVTKTYRSIKGSTALIARNRLLVTLPLESTPDIPIKNKDQFSLRAFQDICGRYGFQSFLEQERFRQWKEYVFKKEK